MSNGEVCCLLQVCCPPADQVLKLSEYLQEQAGCPKEYAVDVSAWLMARFDLAPKGTVQPLIDAIAMMARQHPRR